MSDIRCNASPFCMHTHFFYLKHTHGLRFALRAVLHLGRRAEWLGSLPAGVLGVIVSLKTTRRAGGWNAGDVAASRLSPAVLAGSAVPSAFCLSAWNAAGFYSRRKHIKTKRLLHTAYFSCCPSPLEENIEKTNEKASIESVGGSVKSSSESEWRKKA